MVEFKKEDRSKQTTEYVIGKYKTGEEILKKLGLTSADYGNFNSRELVLFNEACNARYELQLQINSNTEDK